MPFSLPELHFSGDGFASAADLGLAPLRTAGSVTRTRTRDPSGGEASASSQDDRATDARCGRSGEATQVSGAAT